jgi:hypothetical protein
MFPPFRFSLYGPKTDQSGNYLFEPVGKYDVKQYLKNLFVDSTAILRLILYIFIPIMFILLSMVMIEKLVTDTDTVSKMITS